jgi:hypothetical protein
MPELIFGGDQAVRISVFNKGGELLRDVEVDRGGRISLPEFAATVAVTGLGRVAQPPSTQAMGAVTLFQGSEPVPVVGWEANTQLVQVTPTTLLARGAVVRLGSPLLTQRDGHRVDQALVTAGHAVHEQSGVETILPAGVTTLGILLERVDGSADATPSDGLRLSVQRAVVATERPVTVAGGSRGLLLYDVRAMRTALGTISVAVAHKPEWRVAGVFGMRETAAYWARMLAAESMGTLVENGPLTAQGRTRVAFVVEAVPAGV